MTVTNGGQGNASLTAYAVLCGGTTSTNPVQSIAGVGTTGQVLTSNGAGALPTFQAPGGFTFFVITAAATPADSTTYFLQMAAATTAVTASGSAATRFYIPKAGTITACYGATTYTAGSAQNATVAIRLNNTSNTNVTTTLDFSGGGDTAFNNAALSTAVAAGDYIEILFITPAWSPTNPTNVRFAVTVFVQ